MLLGAQTYTIRTYTQSAKDFARSMERLADMGYTAVQLSAIGDIPARDLRSICDDNGLKIALTHTNPDKILRDPEAVLRDHEIMDCPYIGIGAMPERYRSAEWISCFAEDFTPAAELFAREGRRLMYHNHNFEWERLPGGRTLLEALLSDMPASIMGVTLDTYWVQAAGADVLEWIEKLQDRIPCVHFKDMAVQGFEQRMAAIGDGNLPFDHIIALLQKLGKTEYALVEQDNCYGESPFACLKRSHDFCAPRMKEA